MNLDKLWPDMSFIKENLNNIDVIHEIKYNLTRLIHPSSLPQRVCYLQKKDTYKRNKYCRKETWIPEYQLGWRVGAVPRLLAYPEINSETKWMVKKSALKYMYANFRHVLGKKFRLELNLPQHIHNNCFPLPLQFRCHLWL